MKLKSNIAISESGFLFDPNSGESFNVNRTGQFLVKMLAEGKNETEIKALVNEKYEVEPLVFQKYFDDFIMMLRQFGLLNGEE